MGMYECRPRREHSGDNARHISRHEFDPASGWCAWGCGVRNDQRVIKTLTGDVLNEGTEYTPAQIEHFKTWLDQRQPRTASAAPRGDVAEFTAWKQQLGDTA